MHGCDYLSVSWFMCACMHERPVLVQYWSAKIWYQRACRSAIPITVTSNHRSLDCLSNRMFMRRQKKTSKLRVTDLWEGNPQVTGRFPPQKASNTEDVSIWWCHHAKCAFRLSSKINISRIVFFIIVCFHFRNTASYEWIIKFTINPVQDKFKYVSPLRMPMSVHVIPKSRSHIFHRVSPSDYTD